MSKIDIQLSEKPKGVTIIQGFPGIGMVGSISTEFLIEHLKCRQIGQVIMDEIPAVVAIHDGKLVPPVGVYYNEEYNLVILNLLTHGANDEWLFCKMIQDIAWELSAIEIISLEGVGMQSDKHETFVFSNNSAAKEKLDSLGFSPLKESIILGVSAALLQKGQEITAFFVTTASQLPDSAAAAELIKDIDKYVGLKVDSKPLLEQAKLFEEKIKGIIDNSKKAKISKESMTNYVS